MTKKRFHTSLQLKLTLLLSLLMIVSCVLMYFFISHSAVSGMDGLQNYMIKVDPQDGDSPITFNVDPKALFPQFEQEIQETKEDFLFRSVIATTIIILLSSVCTYFLTKKTLTPLQKLTSEVSQIQAQNLSTQLAVPNSKDEIAQLTLQKLTSEVSQIQAQNLSTQLAVPNSKDEIAQLTSSFNEMLARLDNAFSTQKQFSANAAHELRTPLAVLQTNLEVFEKKQEPEMVEYRQLFTMIKEQTARLSQLVGTLLDMTNLKSVPRTDQVTLEELVDEVFCDLDPVAEKAGISIHFNDSANQDSHTDVTGSYVLLYRAVYNLVENAIKYNRPHGSVSVSVKQENGQAMVLVTDTGIGISPENQKKIFDPFFRVDKSRSRAMGGAGLGLALVDSIAKEHGGTVNVLESSEAGSTIALMLPVDNS